MDLQFNRRIPIAGRMIGDGEPCFVVAEAGMAHFGSEEKALRLVDLAADAGADAVKFQIFDTDALFSREGRDWKERFEARRLPLSSFQRIRAHCERRGIIFFATAHDEGAMALLDELDVPCYKIGSGEVRNWKSLEEIGARGKPVILSTGMYSDEDVAEALRAVTRHGNRDVVVLQCVTSYPAPPEDTNLRAMVGMREKFGVLTGYSDHTKGIHIPLASVALGACVLEKHITLDYDVPNAQDWRVSCGVEDLPLLVSQVRDVQSSLGSGLKSPAPSEAASVGWARKSLVAKTDIPAGSVLTDDLLVVRRPGDGIPPDEVARVIGRKSVRDIRRNTQIRWEDLV